MKVSPLLVACLATLTIATATADPIGAAARSFPDTRAKIRVFADQLPGRMSEAQWRFAATHYAGSQKELRSWTRRMRRLNPAFLMLHYQLAVGTGPAAFVHGEVWTNDFEEVSENTTWFLRDERGNCLRQPTWDWYLMDIRFQGGRPRTEFPEYWVRTALQRMRDNENDGCFADSYTQDILIGQLQPAYSLFTEPEENKRDWLPHLNAYGAYCANAFHRQRERFYFLPNLGGLTTTWDTVTDLAVGDGGMNEGFCAARPGRYYSLADWKLQMSRLLELASREKILICQTATEPAALDHRWFLVGSYLLTKGRRSYLNMFQKSSLEWYPEYDLDLGAYGAGPALNVDTYWRQNWGLYRRDYARGMVLVNPSARPVKVARLGGAYRLVAARGGGAVGANGVVTGSLTTTRVTSVTVPAHSARVLLSQ